MHARRTRRTAAPAVIDGDAVVIERRPRAAIRPDAGPARPTNDNRSGATFPARPHPFRPDLVFPGTVRWPGSPDRRSAAQSAAPRRHNALAGLACLAAAAVGCGFAAAPVARTPESPTDAPQAAAFALAEVRGGVAPSRSGAVLTVEGRIRNVSGEARGVPAVTVSVPGAGGFTRSFRPSARPLGGGRSLFFHSTLAVPSATRADAIGLGLAGTGLETFLTP